MNGVFISCLPVSVFSSYFVGNPSEEKGVNEGSIW